MTQIPSLAIILREEFGESFALYDAATGAELCGAGSKGSLASAHFCNPELIKQWAAVGTVQTTPLTTGQYQLVLPLRINDARYVVGVGSLTGFARSQAEVVREQARLQKWAQAVCDRLMMTTTGPIQHRKVLAQEGSDALAWEAIGSLEKVTRRLRVHKEAEKHQQRILQAAAEVIRVQAAIWVPQQADADIVVWGEPGMSSWDCRQLGHRLTKSAELEKSGFLLINNFQGSSWGACFPQITNLLALAVRDQGTQGFFIVVNKRQAEVRSQGSGVRDQGSSPVTAGQAVAPLRRTDVVAISPFAALFGLHAATSARFHGLKDLLVGLARSLTAAIDAKDAYTFGHSERVGRVAVELARELGLSTDEVSDLYLAGLLHDIGKIGIRDAVLCKQGPLTADEKEHLQQHVTIGQSILMDLHPIRHLLPGVLYHHERYDGAGYPEGLKGEAIPFIARILAVADAYDAMSTTRPYRQAMPLDRIESILQEGAGSQWDKNVIAAFFRCRPKIHGIRQRGIGESLRQAIHGALRNEDSSDELASLSRAIQPDR